MFQRRHYEFIAHLLQYLPGFNADQRYEVARQFANEFRRTQPGFKWSRFMAAVGFPNATEE